MTTLKDRNLERRLEMEQKRHKQGWKAAIILFLLVFLCAVGFIIYSFANRSFNSFQVIKQTPREDSNTVRYIRHGSNLLKYSRDGASGIDSKGKILWNGSFEMKNPAVSICDAYAVIADIGGKEAYVFSGSDTGKKIQTTLPIIQADVANQGVTALMMEDKDSNVFWIYDPYGTSEQLKVEKPTNTETDGYPVDMALSDDGKKLVTSYLYLNNGVKESRVSFYNFGDVGRDTNSLVKAEMFGQTLIPEVDFISNNMVCVYGEQSFTLYSMEEIPKKIKDTITFDDPIKSMFSDKSHVGFVLEKYEGESKYEVVVYDMSGKKVLDRYVDYDYTTVLLSGKEIIFYTDLKCTILRLNGKEKFQYTFDKNLEYIMPVNNYNKYILIDSTDIQEIKLVEGGKAK